MNLSKYKGVTCNSKKVKKDYIFVSINNNFSYIEQAIDKGATLIITKQKINTNVENIVAHNIEYFFAFLYKKFYKINMENFTTIAVTGTDGKTTTSFMIYDSINQIDNALYIGTLGIYFNNHIIKTKNTTPNNEIILQAFKLAKRYKIKYIIIEASSEGLLDKRLTGIKFDRIIFTNLSREHLNTHKTMSKYFKAKCIVFKLLKQNGIIISNKEDEYGRKIVKGNILNYGINKGTSHIISLNMTERFTKILLINNQDIYYYKIPFIGIYNIYNFLAAHTVLSTILDVDKIYFNRLNTPPGRFEIIDNIIIDFAHTPNGIESLLLSIKEIYNDKKIILVMGAQGGKDKGKRILLGQVADKYADEVILTSEDPKDEPLIQIIFDISLGLIQRPYTIHFSRKNAIKALIQALNKESIGVIVGKGLETYEQIQNNRYNHSDYKEVKNGLSKLTPNPL